MKGANILSITHAYNNLPEPLFLNYLDFYNVSIKINELKDLQTFTELLQKKAQGISEFNKYYLGYKIPQISKEFDLLRFGENYIVNIELKRSSTQEKIKEQLIQNKYYLSFLGTNILSFTFITDENKLFKLDNNDDLIEDEVDDLIKVLQNQKVKEIENVDSLFNPSNYLVSPFNSTEQFIAGKYFLTNHQEEIKKKTIVEISSNKPSFISILGGAGTGKTLFTYDIIKECLLKKLNVLIIHCGNLNEGHYKLRDEFGWDIIPAKSIFNKVISNYSLVVLDETQRVYPLQLTHIIKEVELKKQSCIFSYDKLQCLRTTEIKNNIEVLIEKKVQPIKFQLTEKIRTNKEIASFIKCILDKSKQVERLDKHNVQLHYFKSYTESKSFITMQQSEGWKAINFTPSNRHNLPYDNFCVSSEDNAHNVIGQEFDKVIAVVDSYFYYNLENKLSTRDYENKPYYHPTKMLLQIMTRTRRKLSFIVIDNNDIMERCLTILNPK